MVQSLKTTHILTLITITEIIVNHDARLSFLLWVLYGFYKLIKDDD